MLTQPEAGWLKTRTFQLQLMYDFSLPQFIGTPTAYIQQIIVKAVVSPWDSRQHIQTDAFRAPLTKAFDIMQQINAFQYKRYVMVLKSFLKRVENLRQLIMYYIQIMLEYIELSETYTHLMLLGCDGIKD